MTTTTRPPLSQLITWEFQIAEQGKTARYGRQGPAFYRQFLPGGIVADQLYPPKLIDERLYTVARAAFDQRQKT